MRSKAVIAIIFWGTIALTDECPDLTGRFLCNTSFGSEVRLVTQSLNDGVTVYNVVSQFDDSTQRRVIRTDNIERQRRVYRVRSWCENGILKQHLYREWDIYRQSHDIEFFRSPEGDLLKTDLTQAYEKGQLAGEKLYKSFCQLLDQPLGVEGGHGT